MTHPVDPGFPDLHIMPVHVTNAHEVSRGTGPPEGYPRSTWVTHTVPLAAAGVKPVQLLQSDERRGRALILSVDQDIFLASTESELLAGPSQAAPQGGYWPKGLIAVTYDSDTLYALSAQTGATRVTVHAESVTP